MRDSGDSGPRRGPFPRGPIETLEELHDGEFCGRGLFRGYGEAEKGGAMDKAEKNNGELLVVSVRGQRIGRDLSGLEPIDVALTLGRLPRWRGAANWWTVLQHSLLVEDLLSHNGQPPAVLAWGLLHDAHEWFTGDVPRPLVTPALVQVQDEIDLLLAQRFGIAETADEVRNLRAAVAWGDDLALLGEAQTVARTIYEAAPEAFEPIEERFVREDQEAARNLVEEYRGGVWETGMVSTPQTAAMAPLVRLWLERVELWVEAAKRRAA